MRYFSYLFEYLLVGLATLFLVLAYAIFVKGVLPESLDWRSPVNLQAEENWLTNWKLERAIQGRDSCLAALQSADAKFEVMPDLITDNPKCGIKNRIELRGIGGVKIADLETSCAAALKLAAWLVYDVEPAFIDAKGASLTGISHFGSYSCRPVRNANGTSSRMSQHATANAIDIAGFKLSNGETITVLNEWQGADHQLLSTLHDKGCKRFNAVLGPDYNSLHADHFHMDLGRWRACR